jgi:molybdenum cofactor cytidylyltransferase
VTTGAEPAGRGGLEAIVLAAGAGERFGGGKLTAPWRGGALLDGALEAAFAAPARAVWLVTGADAGVAWAARNFATRRGAILRLNIVHARDHALGLSASLKAGLGALPTDAAGAFVLLGDMPLIPRDIPFRLALALAGDALASAPVFEGRRGHPVLFSSALFGDLADLEGDEGAREVLEGLGERLALIEAADSGVLFDVDEPADLAGPAQS